MATIFEELFSANQKLNESLNSRKKNAKKESRKIPVSRIKVESRRIFEDADLDDLDRQFATTEDEGNNDEIVLVIDPELNASDDIPEDAAEEMVGDLVYKCPICGSNYVCDCDTMTEGVETDEDGVPTECPVCGEDTEQILVGEIAPAEEGDSEEPMDPQEVDEVVEDEVGEEEIPATESKKKVENKKSSARKARKEDLEISVSEDEEGNVDEVTVEEDGTEVVDAEVVDEEEEEIVEETCGSKKESRSRARRTRRESIVCPECGEDPCVCEDFDSEEDGLVLDTAVATPEEDEEETAPAVDVENSTVEINLNFDNEQFESLMNRVIRENYKGNSGFKTLRCSYNTRRRTLKVEYLVRRQNKKSIRGTMTFEGFSPRYRNMILSGRDQGVFTESRTKTPAFKVECVRRGRVIIPTSVKYDYKVKVNESLYRVVGTAKKSK